MKNSPLSVPSVSEKHVARRRSKNTISRSREDEKSEIFCPLIHHTGTDRQKSHTDKYYSSLSRRSTYSGPAFAPPSIVNSEKFLQLFVCVASATPCQPSSIRVSAVSSSFALMVFARCSLRSADTASATTTTTSSSVFPRYTRT